MFEPNNLTEVQREEILALQSIYPDYVSSKQTSMFAISTPVEFSEDIRVVISSVSASDQHKECIVISALPSMTLFLNLPPGYPDTEPPSIEEIRTKTSWLSVLQSELLETYLLKAWAAERLVLYGWIEDIHSGQFLIDLGLLSTENILSLQHEDPRVLSLQLAIHSKKHKFQQFSSSTYECAICMVPRKGKTCLQLTGCSHIFCRSCLYDFWTSAITEGNLTRVGCPDPECIKEKREATVDEIRAIINPQRPLSASESPKRNSNTTGSHDVGEGKRLFERWLWLREQRDLMTDRHVVYCPVCQAGVRRPPEGADENSGWHRYRMCNTCKFSFCKSCKKTWHGPNNICQLTEEELIRYIEARDSNFGDHTPWMNNIDQEYGPTNVTKQVDEYLPLYRKRRSEGETSSDRALHRYKLFTDEKAKNGRHLIWDKTAKASEIFIMKNTIPCPKCRVATEKVDGCNMVSCPLCGEHFCWGCGQPFERMGCRCQ